MEYLELSLGFEKIRLHRIRINWGSIKRDLSILILLLSQENN